ncbi:hypothetical protein, partial [Campylobacter concisus]|uniref:hypothetical protein n=1 Tax=Campylobacter concisus TaxID=199 RepID=UPI001CA57274
MHLKKRLTLRLFLYRSIKFLVKFICFSGVSVGWLGSLVGWLAGWLVGWLPRSNSEPSQPTETPEKQINSTTNLMLRYKTSLFPGSHPHSSVPTAHTSLTPLPPHSTS